jgi:phosphoribosylpyrophosphate synthetase
MDDRSSITADTLELLHINQIAIRAAVEEVSLWIKQRGSTNVHDNVLTALATIDTNSEGIAKGIELLRSQ